MATDGQYLAPSSDRCAPQADFQMLVLSTLERAATDPLQPVTEIAWQRRFEQVVRLFPPRSRRSGKPHIASLTDGTQVEAGVRKWQVLTQTSPRRERYRRVETYHSASRNLHFFRTSWCLASARQCEGC